MANLYSILGVSQSATDAEIKSAFRKLAKELHPDHNKGNDAAERRFKEVSAAYAILGDKEKRAKYDNGQIDDNGQPTNPFAGAGYGTGGGRSQSHGFGGGGGASFEDIFRQFGGGGGAGTGGGRQSSSGPSDDPFADLFGGFGRAGRSSRAGQAKQSKSSGFGSGADQDYKITIPFMEAVQGTKRQITLADDKKLKVTIPAGVREGQKIRLAGQGKRGFTGHRGDAFLEVHIEKHPFFKRDGDDIYIEVPLAIDEALLGAKISVPTVHGDVNLNIPAYTDSGKKLRLRGKGVKNGDQYVSLKIVWPDKEDPELEKAIKNWRAKSFYRPRNGNS